MENLRIYGKAPFTVAVIHGGPGAGGEMAPVCRELSSCFGILEPVQTATTIRGQVEELKQVLEEEGAIPIKLVGFSWGAWLSFIFAAIHPSMVERLILIGSGPFEERYAAGIMEARLSRLRIEDRAEVLSIMKALEDRSCTDDLALEAMGSLLSRADAYDPLEHGDDAIRLRADIFQSIWNEASELRRSGRLLEMGRSIKCPVVCIHGDYDPHPAEGVLALLTGVLKEFRFILLKNCGHKPWIERQSLEQFYKELRDELLQAYP